MPPDTSRGAAVKIADPTSRQVILALQDRVSQLEAQMTTLLATALRTGSPINAFGEIIQNVADPKSATDAVNAQTMVKYVQNYVKGVGAIATPGPSIPGIPGNPNTIPGDALPLYNGLTIVQGVFAAHPDFVARSCQASGGTWELMDAIVDALRAVDTRFAYNGKRGNSSDPSNDAISYDYGAVAGGEGTTSVYVVDVISGHCGANPQPAFNDVTVFAPGVWISRGRF